MLSDSRLAFAFILGTLLLAPAGRAQAPEVALSLQDAVNMALSRNPQVLVAQAQLEELKGRIKEVRSAAFPQLTVEGEGVRMRDPSFLNSSSFDKLPPEFLDALSVRSSNLFDVALNVKQPLYTAGKVGNAVKLAKEGLEEKEANLQTVRQHIIYSVFQAFHDILLAQENLKLVEETHEQRMKHLEMARNRFSQGIATEIDVLRSQVNLANMEPERIQAGNRVRMAQAALNNLIVADIDLPVRIAGRLEHRPWQAPPLAELQEHALEVRPELIVARRQVDQARLLLALTQAENKPSLDLGGRFGYSTRDPRNQFNYQYSRWNITLNFKLTVYDSGRKGGMVAQAGSRLQASEHSLAQLTNNVRLEIKEAHDVLQSSAEAIAAARLSVTQAERVLSMMQANYQYGAATTLDVVDSEAALVAARNSQMNATYLYQMAKARLRLAAGSPILDEEVKP